MNNKYVEYFKIGFKKSIEYKSYFIGILTTPTFMGFFFYFIWQYIYEMKYQVAIKSGEFMGKFSEFTIGGFTFNEMLVYLIIGLLINASRSSDISNKISEVIKSGDIAIYLCRPVNFVKSLLADSIGGKVINLIIFIILLIIMTNLFNLPYPKGWTFIIFIIYAILMILFDIILYIIIGGLSFWFIEIWGIRASIEQIIWIFSGRVLPLTLFPSWIKSIMVFTPFMYLEYTFASIYLGKLSIQESLKAMEIFIIWIFLLIILMRYLYKKGFKKLEAFGG